MTRAAAQPDAHRGGVVEIAFVNNMPDQALVSTLAQFTRLVTVAAPGQDIRLRSYALPSTPRSDMARRYLAQTHEDIEALYLRGADALIVTGAEPRAARLEEEPYWSDFTRLVDWARDHTTSAVWSCLAAHAAVLRLDGIERRRAEKKISGVYAVETAPDVWAMQGAPRKILVPHSRYNDISRADLEKRGYAIASWSCEIGVDTFWRREPSLFLFLQGHPEYDAESLSKEYRRDTLRFFADERADYPEPPQGYFASQTLQRLDALKQRVLAEGVDGRERELSAVLDGEKRRSPWLNDSTRLYRNWLNMVMREKAGWRHSA